MIYICQPCFKCGHYKARMSLMKVIKNIAIAPFGKVNFRDYFLSECLISFGIQISVTGFAFRFYNLEKSCGLMNDSVIRNFGLFLIWAGFLPIWSRFW